MSKKPIRYIRYYYCIVCQEEFFLSSDDEKACLYCGSKDSFILLSKKEETEKEIIERFKKDIAVCKKLIRQGYLEGSFQKSEREDLDRLKELKDMENFLKRNPNLNLDDVLKLIDKKSELVPRD